MFRFAPDILYSTASNASEAHNASYPKHPNDFLPE
jgi:hypothetical protein